MALTPQIVVPDLDFVGAMSRDPTARLTAKSRAKFKTLERAAQRATDLMQPSQDRAREKHNAYRRAEAERDEARIAWEDEKVEADGIAAHWQAIRGLVTDLESWIRNLPRRARVVDYDGKPPVLRKGETAQDALMRAERDLQALAVRRSALEAAPIASGDMKAAIRRFVGELNAAAIPDLSHALLSGNPADIRYTTESAPTHSITPQGDQISGHARVVDPIALLAWANPELLIQRLEEEADALAGNDADAITKEDRAAGLEEVETQRLALERVAEHWTETLEAQGVPVLRRRDAAPEAVLGIIVEDHRNG